MSDVLDVDREIDELERLASTEEEPLPHAKGKEEEEKERKSVDNKRKEKTAPEMDKLRRWTGSDTRDTAVKQKPVEKNTEDVERTEPSWVVKPRRPPPPVIEKNAKEAETTGSSGGDKPRRPPPPVPQKTPPPPVARKTKSMSSSGSGEVRPRAQLEITGSPLAHGDSQVLAACGNGDLLASGEDAKKLTAANLRPLLEKSLVYTTGGMEEDRYPILTFPEAGLRLLETPCVYDELVTTLRYFKAISRRPEVTSAGITLLMDARNNKTHNSVKLILERFQDESECPFPIHHIYILLKSGRFSKPKLPISPDVLSKHNPILCYDTKLLMEHLELANVTMDMGGGLRYSHVTWIENRVHYEKLLKLHSRAMRKLPVTINELNHFEMAESVGDAERLMQEGLRHKETMIGLIAEVDISVDSFVGELEQQQPMGLLEISPTTRDHINMLAILKGMLEELKGKSSEFDEFWSLHKDRLDHMMRMCHFNRTAEKVKRLMQGHIEDLTSSEPTLGDTLEVGLELGEKHELFVTKCVETMDEQLEKIREDAKELTNPTFDPQAKESDMHTVTRRAIEVVRDQLTQLTQTYQQMMKTCNQRRDLFIVCVKFHMTVRQCQQWHQEVLEYLAAQPMEAPTHQTAMPIMASIDGFLMRMPPSQLAILTEIAVGLPGPRFNKICKETTSRSHQTRELLDARKAGLLKVLAAKLSPPKAPKGKSKEKPPISTPFATASLRKSPVSDVPDGLLGVVRKKATSPPPPESPNSPSRCVVPSPEESKEKSAAEFLKGRQFVYKELMATEHDYIKDLKTVIDSYYDEMDPDDLRLPLRLRGKRDIVFGNMLEIYEFHDTVFCKALSRYENRPEMIGECFVEHTTEFQMYSVYCKNRTSSETIINESTESQAYFKGIMMKLGHQLPLNSYLLKPIQRVTKYQLLLKDMMKNSRSAKEAHSDLQSALDRMLLVLRTLNDSLHVVGLKGFPGALAEQGRLLVHDAFQVWETAGRTHLFSRGRERHVFLFEKVVIFSKKVEAAVQKQQRKSDTYHYKDHLQMAEMAVREADHQPMQFELMIHGQARFYRCQAASLDIQQMWVKEIRRLLQAQFSLMKDMVLQSGTLDRRAYKGKVPLPTQRQQVKLFGDSLKNGAAKKSKPSRFGRLMRREKKDVHPKKALNPTASLPVIPGHLYPARQTVSHEDLFSMPASRDGLRTPDSDFGDTISDGLSSDEELPFSDEEEDEPPHVAVEHYESLLPGASRYYTAISDYNPGSDENGISLSESQEVEVIGINQFGWWWVRSCNHYTNDVSEGWVPASYLRVSDVQTGARP